jgi:uncharacterized protein (DUF2062 family)
MPLYVLKLDRNGVVSSTIIWYLNSLRYVVVVVVVWETGSCQLCENLRISFSQHDDIIIEGFKDYTTILWNRTAIVGVAL